MRPHSHPTQSEERLALPVSERDHSRGPAHAPVTLVEYGDFECPYCGEAYEVVRALQQRLGERLRFVYRNFPLTDKHPRAEPAAEAAEAAAAQDRFWQMHDALYENQDGLEDEDLAAYAADLGLDNEQFLHDLETGAYEPRVREDYRSGADSGVNGTPTFFINGRRYDGDDDFETLLAVLSRKAGW